MEMYGDSAEEAKKSIDSSIGMEETAELICSYVKAASR